MSCTAYLCRKQVKMNTYFNLILTFFVIFSSYSQITNSKQNEVTFQTLLDSRKQNTTGILMAINAPDININWQGAVGYDSKEKENILKQDQPFRIASITKTYTAVAILRLSEMGLLNINDPIDDYISEEHKEILKKDNYDLNIITIKQCLQQVVFLIMLWVVMIMLR